MSVLRFLLALAKRKLVIGLVAVVVILVILNVIFGYVVASSEDPSKLRCMYSLYRVGVALVEYSNVNNTTMTPPSLQSLVEQGILEDHWLRCSRLGPRFGYFGEFDLLGPKPPVILWCESGHSAQEAGISMKVTYALMSQPKDGQLKVVRCSFRYLEAEIEAMNSIRTILACNDSQEDIDMLLGYASGDGDSVLREFAVWKLGRMRSNAFESTFLGLLDQDMPDNAYEAAEALALLGNPAGGALLLARLRGPDYYGRRRSFNAIKELAGESFGFNPVLEAQSQPEAMSRIDEWWSKTASSLRESGKKDEKGNPEDSGQ